MFSEEKENKLKAKKEELRKVQKEISELRHKEYMIDNEYIELLKEKCRENIGRCFKRLIKGEVVSYCKIIDIDKATPRMGGVIDFNEYQYPALWFRTSCNSMKSPFFTDNIFSGVWGKGDDIVDKLNGVSYIEIDSQEFNEKFNEINLLWSSKIAGEEKLGE